MTAEVFGAGIDHKRERRLAPILGHDESALGCEYFVGAQPETSRLLVVERD
jgi:hypothetical protein